MDVAEIDRRLREDHGVGISRAKWKESNAPPAVLDVHGKAILREGDEAILGQFDVTAYDVARAFQNDEVCDDVKEILNQLARFAA